MLGDEKWTTLARKWMYYLPPGRPSNTDLREIRGIIQRRLGASEKINALILGATPEFRDLLYTLDASVSVVDRNPDMIKATSYLRLFDSKEQIHGEDWFDFLPRNEGAFDLILSDFTQGNMHYDRQEEFYWLVSNALAPHGYFVDRVLTFRSQSLVYSSKDLLKHFANCPLNLVTLNNVMFQLFFASDLTCQWEMVDVDRMFGVMEKHSEQDPGLRKFVTFMKEFIFGEGLVWYYGRDWTRISENYFKHLELVEEIPDTETVYAGFAYIIVSTAKRSQHGLIEECGTESP